MRLYGSQRGKDCGPIAIYNMDRLLHLPGAQGGYQANFRRLGKLTDYDPRTGSKISYMERAIRHELRGSRFKLIRRRPIWSNVVTQLVRAPAPAIGLCVWKWEDSCHMGVLWVPYGRSHVVLGVGFTVAITVAPIWYGEGPDYWPTTAHPYARDENAKLRHFWQIVPR